jgi:anti-sigma-K factor RskA
MNTPADDGDSELRYAEYVLGLLDAQERAGVEREVAASESAAAAVAFWQQRLLPLAEELELLAPAPEVWERISAALGLATTRQRARRDPRPGLWENLRFWRWATVASGALLAAGCMLLVFFVLRRPAAPAIPYMASTITETSGRIGWTATMDIGNARMFVVPTAPQPLTAGRAPELWLIPKGGKPIAVGMISTSGPVAIQLAPTLVAQLGPTSVLAVSVEPPAGSPTGQPTGPVIATGSIGAAPSGANGTGAATVLRSLPAGQRHV